MSFSLEQILAAVHGGELRVGPDAVGFVALAVAEQICRGGSSFDSQSTCLEPSGSVTLDAIQSADPEEAESALRGWLGRAIALSDWDEPALLSIADGPCEGDVALRDALIAALVPLNRGAARRALARLHRRLEQIPKQSMTAHASSYAQRDAPSSGVLKAPPMARPESGVAIPLFGFSAGESAETVRSVPPVVDAAASAADLRASETLIVGSIQVTAVEDAAAAVSERTVGTDPRETETREQSAVEGAESSRAYHPAFTPRAPHAELPPLEPAVVVQSSDPVQDSDAAGAVAGSRPASGPIFDHFVPRRSDVNALVERFSVVGDNDTEDLSKKLRQAAEVYSNFPTPRTPSARSQTPPPVEFGDRSTTTGRPAISAAWAVGVCLVLLIGWLVRPQAGSSVAAESSACLAAIEVRAAERSTVRLVSGAKQVVQQGPVAMFSQVRCEEDAEVIVLLPEDTTNAIEASSDPSAGWLRVPVPAKRLQAASESGAPLVVSVFGSSAP